MTTTLVVIVMETYRAGLVEALSKALAAHHGNWLESRIAGLGGRFAGILLASIPDRSTRPKKQWRPWSRKVRNFQHPRSPVTYLGRTTTDLLESSYAALAFMEAAMVYCFGPLPPHPGP